MQISTYNTHKVKENKTAETYIGNNATLQSREWKCIYERFLKVQIQEIQF